MFDERSIIGRKAHGFEALVEHLGSIPGQQGRSTRIFGLTVKSPVALAAGQLQSRRMRLPVADSNGLGGFLMAQLRGDLPNPRTFFNEL